MNIGSPNGMPVRFTRSKSKELFAYLIYRKGASCTNHEIIATIFEEESYSDEESQLSYLRHIVSSLITNLTDAGYPGIVQKAYKHDGKNHVGMENVRQRIKKSAVEHLKSTVL